jgi:3-phosphoshikimate 1-carboxyvinyltransferase
MKISWKNSALTGTPELPASKSITNRLLIIRALCDTPFTVENISDAADSQNLQDNLQQIQKHSQATLTIDVGPAGTNMRFLTALLAVQPGTFVIKGSARMHQRPVAPLVEALRQLGAQITYLEKKGYPPLKIEGATLPGNKVTMASDVSSQFISALMMIGPVMPEGLTIVLSGEKVSFSYIAMTQKLMQQCGARLEMAQDTIQIKNSKYHRSSPLRVESDWSAASYWYGMLAIAPQGSLKLNGLKEDSLQGDAVLHDWMKDFGIQTTFAGEAAWLEKNHSQKPAGFSKDFLLCPDLAQTFMALAAALEVHARFSGLRTLRIKETDRLKAMKSELKKFGVQLQISGDQVEIIPQKLIESHQSIKTYHDHRMAMALTMLAVRTGEVIIENPGVVEKSYPGFWKELEKVGFEFCD